MADAPMAGHKASGDRSVKVASVDVERYDLPPASPPVTPDGEPGLFNYEGRHPIKFELFFDLWLVANIQVLGEAREIERKLDFVPWLGYLSMLWSTWLLIGLFDVRFMTDTMFGRAIRVFHLGSMMAFSTLAHPINILGESNDEEVPPELQRYAGVAMALVLMVSRLVLGLQYLSILRKTETTRTYSLTLMKVAGLHFLPALTYAAAAIQYRFQSAVPVFLPWAVISFVEILVQLSIAAFSELMKLSGNQLSERLSSLTVIMIGEGVSEIAKSILLITKDGNGWSSDIFGICIAAVATLYLLFLLYFDWMEPDNLGGVRLIAYASLHFPFHAAQLYFSVGSSIYIKVSRVFDNYMSWDMQIMDYFYEHAKAIKEPTFPTVTLTSRNASALMAEKIFNISLPFIGKKEIPLLETSLEPIKQLPDLVWKSWKWNQEQFNKTGANSTVRDTLLAEREAGSEVYSNAVYAIEDLVLEFQMKLLGVSEYELTPAGNSTTSGHGNGTLSQHQEENAILVGEDLDKVFKTFQFVLANAGVMLAAMLVLHIATKRQWKKSFDFVLLPIIIAIIVLVGTLPHQLLHSEKDLFTAIRWVLPSVCLGVFLVFCLVHLRSWENVKSSRVVTFARPVVETIVGGTYQKLRKDDVPLLVIDRGTKHVDSKSSIYM